MRIYLACTARDKTLILPERERVKFCVHIDQDVFYAYTKF